MLQRGLAVIKQLAEFVNEQNRERDRKTRVTEIASALKMKVPHSSWVFHR